MCTIHKYKKSTHLISCIWNSCCLYELKMKKGTNETRIVLFLFLSYDFGFLFCLNRYTNTLNASHRRLTFSYNCTFTSTMIILPRYMCIGLPYQQTTIQEINMGRQQEGITQNKEKKNTIYRKIWYIFRTVYYIEPLDTILAATYTNICMKNFIQLWLWNCSHTLYSDYFTNAQSV